jgi:methylase of polypeptide subunit release factors
MLHPSIRLEGSILSADILDAIERGDRSHQAAKDFGLDPTAKVKDEIADAWAAARAYWSAYQVKISRLREGATGTTETRNQWMVPLLGLLGYQLSLAESETIQGKTYRISHRDATRDQLPVHLLGWHESLDRRSTVPNAPRMSPHGLLQEYINLTEHLYGIVSNGRLLRLLRDSSRLVKLTFIEFDLERIFTEELFADFALLYRLLHASRLPVKQDAVAEAPIEIYHQDSLDSGSRIRSGLSAAVHIVILSLGNGFLSHPSNDRLRELAAADANGRFSMDFYAHLLRLIYRLLFLMVIEERGLAHVPSTDKRLREIYDLGYSLARLRRLAEKPHFAEARHQDAWLALLALFRLVDESGRGLKLGVAPLGGDLFNAGSLGLLEDCSLDNATLLGALRQLTLFTNPVTNQKMRVNYGALNVEEFGSVYQGLLEYEPRVTRIDEKWHFAFAQGDERAATGSHYTEDELVQPLIKHSLDHIIAEKLKQPDPAAALLSLRVADISCGSGHILLAAARRIATELAIIRTGDDQPSPAAFREAIREVIRNCIYGVDLNPLAVELCKVALWLEAHAPGEPLNFLDHHIKCGNAIVGFVTREELNKGIPDEAFATLNGDDADIASGFRKRNKAERKERAATHSQLPLAVDLQTKLDDILAHWQEIAALPEKTPAQIAAKKRKFNATSHEDSSLLRQIASIPIAQFYQPKTAGNKANLITDAAFRDILAGRLPSGGAVASASAIVERKKTFHWFLEFPDIIAKGGFDCILGNPPYLGGSKISTLYGHELKNLLSSLYDSISGQADLVTFFLRRAFALVRSDGFLSIITTDSVASGATADSGLLVLSCTGATIIYAQKGIRWPGEANATVATFSIQKGKYNGPRFLNNRQVANIGAGLCDESEDNLQPKELLNVPLKSFTGSKIYGDGFVLTPTEAAELFSQDDRNREVIFPYLTGDDINSMRGQEVERYVIDFRDMPLTKAQAYTEPFNIVEQKVKPYRDELEDGNPAKKRWWQYERRRPELYEEITRFETVFVMAQTSKTFACLRFSTDWVFSVKCVVFATNSLNDYAILQSVFHESWSWRWGTPMGGGRLQYALKKCAHSFPFPKIIDASLEALALTLENHRSDLTIRLWLGLTDIYNLFHAPDLEARLATLYRRRSASRTDWRSEVPVEHSATAGSLTQEQARDAILQLRTLHRELDQAVLTAYGWHQDSSDGPVITLGHDFQQVETLPENDRTRYTITPQARKDLLTRLLKLNHQRAAEEQNATAVQAQTTSTLKTAKQGILQMSPEDSELFRHAANKPGHSEK